MRVAEAHYQRVEPGASLLTSPPESGSYPATYGNASRNTHSASRPRGNGTSRGCFIGAGLDELHDHWLRVRLYLDRRFLRRQWHWQRGRRGVLEREGKERPAWLGPDLRKRQNYSGRGSTARELG